MLGWLDRLAAKLNRKVEPSAVAMGGENQTTGATAAVASEVRKEEEEEALGSRSPRPRPWSR